MSTEARDLDELRREIDALDDELVALLDRRAGLSHAVARVKRCTGEPVLDPERERRIVERVLRRAGEGARFPDEDLRAIFRAIFEGSRRVQIERLGSVPGEDG